MEAKAVQQDPAALYGAAARAYQAGRMAEAKAQCAALLRDRPDHAEALHLMGALLHQEGQTPQGLAMMERAIAAAPGRSIYHCNRANLLFSLDRFEEAVAATDRALALDPARPEAYANLSNALRGLNRYDEAAAMARKAIALRPRYHEAWTMLANALKARGDLDEAIAAYDRVAALRGNQPGVLYNKALALLLKGDLNAGFEAYLQRWDWAGFPSQRWPSSLPRWDGRPLDGTLLLWAEQGMGDTIQFVRYAQMARARCRRTVLSCKAELLRLMEGVAGVDAVVDRAAGPEAGGPFAACAPLLDLPHIFGTTLANVPAEVPYLKADRAETTRWRKRLKGEGLAVGLAWAGSPQHRNDRNRSCALADFAPLAGVPGVRFFSLQKGPLAAQADSPPAGMPVVRLDAELTNFAETAGALAHLDLLIAVDTAVVHLAGALGRPAWAVLPYAPDWRWLRGREDSPWYPGLRLFRQPASGDRAGVFRQVAESLAALSAGRS